MHEVSDFLTGLCYLYPQLPLSRWLSKWKGLCNEIWFSNRKTGPVAGMPPLYQPMILRLHLRLCVPRSSRSRLCGINPNSRNWNGTDSST
ncbi:hypothetical protein MRB53_036319 [Persea americana]|nr:hypothetical protein MRB53_042413 [Persea americana]KAJ8609161.1 hypothetical protein MRB53_039276 [Persea americana]KAJ8614756.1 hypothetical protein MRB53_036422 [Persea americana]KAJ8614906.1 hypothetical protein MRB53_036319 [Persea americana]